jgi:potassium channel subfamily K, other eukaryote
MIGAVVFWEAEKNQKWTYFESVYFSYTSLLTIGYGDFQPVSNSGKPFFVFWSLLAIPTLTILISNMGDTIIRLIKDATIWLGEITVLPSEAGSIRQSLKFGITKLMGGKIDVQGIRDADDDVEEMPTGLIRMPRRKKQEPSHNREDVENAQKLASNFEQAEKLDEDEARRQGDKLAEDVHHYRHMLIREIRNVYADVNAVEPKKYTYEEWSYFLQLLGEDEGDQKYHRKAPLNVPTRHQKKSMDESIAVSKEEQEGEKDDDAGQMHAAPDSQENNLTGQTIKRWSWIGNRSPLLEDREEAEWVLEKLLARLEDELQREMKRTKKLRAKKEEETGEKQDTPRWPLRRVEDRKKDMQVPGDQDDDGSGGSSNTLQAHAGREEKDSRPTSSEKGSRRVSVEEGKDSKPPRLDAGIEE